MKMIPSRGKNSERGQMGCGLYKFGLLTEIPMYQLQQRNGISLENLSCRAQSKLVLYD